MGITAREDKQRCFTGVYKNLYSILKPPRDDGFPIALLVFITNTVVEASIQLARHSEIHIRITAKIALHYEKTAWLRVQFSFVEPT